MNEIKYEVIEILKSYAVKTRKISQLKYELKTHAAVMESEMIESLVFGGFPLDNSGGQSNRISDKTMTTALRYHDSTMQANAETIAAIKFELCSLETDVGRLEHYISLLDKLQARIIKLFYFENMGWLDMEKELHMSKRTLMNYRDSAVSALITMYSYMYDFRETNTDK